MELAGDLGRGSKDRGQRTDGQRDASVDKWSCTKHSKGSQDGGEHFIPDR